MDRVVRVRGRVGPHVERQRDRPAQSLEHLFTAPVAEYGEAVGERRDVGCFGPRHRLGRRVGREDQEHGRDRDAALGGRWGRGVGQVARHVIGNQLGRARRADGRRERGAGRGELGGSGRHPDRRPILRDGTRLGLRQRRLGRDHQELIARGGPGGPVRRITRLVGVGQVARPAGAVCRDQIGPGRPLYALVTGRAPHPLPVPLDVAQLGGREVRLEGVDRAVVGIDAHPQLRGGAVTAGLVAALARPGGAEPRLEAHREQYERCGVGQLPRGFPRIVDSTEADDRLGQPGVRVCQGCGELGVTPAGVAGRRQCRPRGRRGGLCLREPRPRLVEGVHRSISSACTATMTGGRNSS